VTALTNCDNLLHQSINQLIRKIIRAAKNLSAVDLKEAGTDDEIGFLEPRVEQSEHITSCTASLVHQYHYCT